MISRPTIEGNLDSDTMQMFAYLLPYKAPYLGWEGQERDRTITSSVFWHDFFYGVVFVVVSVGREWMLPLKFTLLGDASGRCARAGSSLM
jgi:hypothetical protein